METNDNKTTSSIRVNKDLWLRARMKALSKGMKIGEVIESLLKDWTREKETGKKVLLDTNKPTDRPEEEKEKKRPTRRSLDTTDENETPTREKGSRFRGPEKD